MRMLEQCPQHFYHYRIYMSGSTHTYTWVASHTHTHTHTIEITRATTTASLACSKCGTMRKSGKRSCCAPGGAWYKNCGSADNAKVGHTWLEGLQTCRDYSGSSSLQSQAKLRQEQTWVESNVTHERNDTHQHIVHSPDANTSGDETTDCESFHSLARVVSLISFLFISWLSNHD